MLAATCVLLNSANMIMAPDSIYYGSMCILLLESSLYLPATDRFLLECKPGDCGIL